MFYSISKHWTFSFFKQLDVQNIRPKHVEFTLAISKLLTFSRCSYLGLGFPSQIVNIRHKVPSFSRSENTGAAANGSQGGKHISHLLRSFLATWVGWCWVNVVDGAPGYVVFFFGCFYGFFRCCFVITIGQLEKVNTSRSSRYVFVWCLFFWFLRSFNWIMATICAWSWRLKLSY